MTEIRQTDNDRLRHTLAQRAKARATAHLRIENEAQFDVLVSEERDKDGEASRSLTYRRAEQRLRTLHPGGYNVWYVLHLDRLYRENDYRPASVKRRPPELERVATALDILLAHARQEESHTCDVGPCRVCDAVNEVDWDARLGQAA